MSKEEVKQERMAKLGEAFTQADANGDGLLNAEEYLTFQTLMQNAAAERGDFVDRRDGYPAKWFALANRVNGETDGATMQDFMTVMGSVMVTMMALKAEKDK